jgi:4-deoxy-L-threo-5-hexosulose-uronate ketol-isomerase
MKIRDQSLSLLAGNLPTAELRSEFLVSGLFQSGSVNLHWWETDRTVIGGVAPTTAEVALHNPAALRAASFFERREAGIVNLGGPGLVRVDGADHALAPLDALYVGRGAKAVTFRSTDAARPTRPIRPATSPSSPSRASASASARAPTSARSTSSSIRAPSPPASW